jgi:hypothetical protein
VRDFSHEKPCLLRLLQIESSGETLETLANFYREFIALAVNERICTAFIRDN